MAKYQQTKHSLFHLPALTLVKVLISLAIISAVFVFIINATLDGLKKAKDLELQDQMLSHAAEAVQIIKAEQAAGWDTLVEKFTTGRAAITYTSNRQASLTAINTPNGLSVSSDCFLRSDQLSTRNAFPSYNACAGLSIEPSGTEAPFGRFMTASQKTNSRGEVESYEIRVIVACFADQCNGAEFKPVELTTYIYKTISE